MHVFPWSIFGFSLWKTATYKVSWLHGGNDLLTPCKLFSGESISWELHEDVSCLPHSQFPSGFDFFLHLALFLTIDIFFKRCYAHVMVKPSVRLICGWGVLFALVLRLLGNCMSRVYGCYVKLLYWNLRYMNFVLFDDKEAKNVDTKCCH